MAKIFISYRRIDSAYVTGVVRDQLASHLPGCEVFFDVDSIPYGIDFRSHLENSVSQCDILLAVIGKSWLTAADGQGQRRIDDPNDAVRVEVETALNRKIPLIPLFIENVDVPRSDQLPASIRGLVGRNGMFVRPPPDFNRDVADVIHAVKQIVEGGSPSGRPTPGHVAAASSSKPPRRAMLVGIALALVAIVASVAFYFRHAADVEYEFVETYLFEDSDSRPKAGEPHSRMLGDGFQLPVHFVHWAVVVTHPKNLSTVLIPVEARLLDSAGEIVRFSGLTADLPTGPDLRSGRSEWIFTFGPGRQEWKPDTYTLQMSTPTKTISTSFKILGQ